MTDTPKPKPCAGCGRDLTAPDATREERLARAYSKARGYHNKHVRACANCGAETTWTLGVNYATVPDMLNHYGNTLDNLREYAHDNGSHFFDPGSMRFFDSRISPDSITWSPEPKPGVVFFITSEQFHDYTHGWHEPRQYTVRYMTAGAHIFELGGHADAFGRYSSLRAAKRELARYLADPDRPHPQEFAAAAATADQVGAA